MKKSSKAALFTIFLVIFLDLVGVGVVIPILPSIILDPASNLVPEFWSAGTRTTVLGLMLGAFPIFSFIGAPILGTLSDIHGRRKILGISIFGTFIGYIIFAAGLLTGQLWMLFAGRILDGFTGGSIAVANSAIADISPNPTERAKNFGLIGMAFGIGLVIGPAIGGILSDPNILPWFNNALPFWFIASLSLVNLALVYWKLDETYKPNVLTKVSLFLGIQHIKKAFQIKRLRLMFVLTFLHQFGFFFYAYMFPVFLLQKFDFSTSEIGAMYAYIGIWIAISQGIINRIVVNKVKSEKILIYSFPLLAGALILQLVPAIPLWLLLTQPLVAIFEGISYPNVTNVISKLATEDQQGEIMGITASVRSLASAAAPVFSGMVLALGVNIPTITAAGVLLLAWLIYFFGFNQKTIIPSLS